MILYLNRILISYDSEWNTGISIPIMEAEDEDSIFPVQKYDWQSIEEKLKEYVELVLQKVG